MRTIVLAMLIAAGFVPRTPQMNLDFESGTLGREPAGWRTSGAGFEATLVDRGCPQGRACAQLSGSRGVLYGTIATPRRIARDMQPRSGLNLAAGRASRRVRFRAAVRVEGAGAVSLWVGAGRQLRKSRMITGRQWNYYEVEAEIGRDARQIVFGFLLSREGTAWVDDASFEEVRNGGRQAVAIMKV